MGSIVYVSERIEVNVIGTSEGFALRSQMDPFNYDFAIQVTINSVARDMFANGDLAFAGVYCQIDGNDCFIHQQFIEGTGVTWEWDINGTTGSASASSSDVTVKLSRSANSVTVRSEGVDRETVTVAGDITNLSIRTLILSAAGTANATATFDNWTALDGSGNELVSNRILLQNNTGLLFVDDDTTSTVIDAALQFTGTTSPTYSATCADFDAETPQGTPYCTEL